MIYLDRLTAASLVWLLPNALGSLIKAHRRMSVCYFESSVSGRALLAILKPVRIIAVEMADYSFADVLDSSGSNPRIRAGTIDALEVCRRVRSAVFEASPTVGRLGKRFDGKRVLLYLEKRLGLDITPLLFQIYVVSWLGKSNGMAPDQAVYFMQRTVFRRWLEEFSAGHQVPLKWYGFWWSDVGVPFGGIVRVTVAAARRALRTVTSLSKVRRGMKMVLSAAKGQPPTGSGDHGGPPKSVVAAAYFGLGLSFDLSKRSELFWVPFAELSPHQLLVYFPDSDCPLDDDTYADLRGRSIDAVALSDSTRESPDVPVWWSRVSVRTAVGEIARAVKSIVAVLFSGFPRPGIDWWIRGTAVRFILSYSYWRCFFKSLNVRVHVGLGDWSAERVASDQALADLGGVSVSYQRSAEDFPSTLWSSAVDVRFNFSVADVEAKRESNAYINQYVVSGYTSDHAFSLVKPRAAMLRQQLEGKGARFIVCFLDGNSMDDKRKGFTHENRAEDYRYLLEKLIADPELGLIFKPKKPRSLRQRLGNVAAMLDEGVATGRCFIFEEASATSTEALPCEASLAADVAIALLWGPTPGIESALAGTPTMFIDRAPLNYHPLYALGEGEVVFKDWEGLWGRIMASRKDPAFMPSFGNGSAKLDEFDPFRDGRAAERIGSYIGWTAKGLEEGLLPGETMARARERYIKLWGADKEVSLR